MDGGGGNAAEHSNNAQEPPTTKDYLSPDVHSAETENCSAVLVSFTVMSSCPLPL